MKRKILSVLVVFAMVLTLLPVTAFAEGIEASITESGNWKTGNTPDSAVTIAPAAEAVTITLEDDIDFGSQSLTINDSSSHGVTLTGAHTLKVDSITVQAGTLTLSKGLKIGKSDSSLTITVNDGAKLTVGDKSYTGGTSNASISVVNTDTGAITLTGNSIKTEAGTVTVNDKEFAISGGEVTLTSDGKATGKDDAQVVVDGVTYKAVGSSADDLDVTISSSSNVVAKAQVSGLKATNKITINGSEYEAVSEAGITVKSDSDVTLNSGSVKVPNTKTIKVGENTYTVADASGATVAYGEDAGTVSAGTVTMTDGQKVKLAEGAKVKINSQDYEAAEGGATVEQVETSAAKLDAGSVKVPDEQAIKVGENTYTAKDGVATVGYNDGTNPTVESGKITLGSSGAVSVDGRIVSGEGIDVDSEGKVTVPKDTHNTVTIDGTEITNGNTTTESVELTVTADKIEATLGAEGDKLTVTGTESVTINDVTYTAGEGITSYDVTYGDPASTGNTVTANGESGELTAEVPEGSKVTVDSTTIAGADGGKLSIEKSSSNTTIKDANNPDNDLSKGGTLSKSETPAPQPSGGSTTKSYKINTPAAEHGRVYANPIQAVSGTKITLTVYPSSGYELYKLTVTTKGGQNVSVSGSGNTYTFTLPDSDVTVKALFAKPGEIPEEPDEPDVPATSTFVDVADSDYFADAVAWAVENGITDGIGNNLFAPQSSCTRAQIVTFLWRAAGSPEPASSANPFADVNANDYYGKAVLWAVEQGITNGTSATEFAPNATCTRAQAVTFLHRYEKQPTASGSSFADVADGAYYESAVDWAVANDITNGTGNNLFAPDATCTRAQIVTFLYRDMVK